MGYERSSKSTATRRTILRRGGAGLVGLAALAGCTEEVGEELPPNRQAPVSELKPDLPVHERTDVTAERITEMAEEEIADPDDLVGALDGYALDVESIERELDVLTIEYMNTDPYAEGTLHDVAPIAGGYAALVGSGYDAVALSITILDAAPASFGTAEIATELAQRYNAGELTAEEYGELVATTIESKRHPPEIEAEE